MDYIESPHSYQGVLRIGYDMELESLYGEGCSHRSCVVLCFQIPDRIRFILTNAGDSGCTMGCQEAYSTFPVGWMQLSPSLALSLSLYLSICIIYIYI